MNALPVYTPIYQDETLSSWLIRAALNQACEPLTLTGFYWPEYRLWTYDIDRGFDHIDPDIYQNMANLLGNKGYECNAHSLQKHLESINEKSVPTGIMQWVIPRSARNRNHKIGQQFCPLCLDCNHSSYLKKDWRIAWNIGCIEHGILLADKCFKCGTHFTPHLLTQEKRFINICHQCGTKIGDDVPLEKMSKNEIACQLKFDEILKQNQGRFTGIKISAKDWFSILRYFICLLRKVADKPNHHNQSRFLANLGLDLSLLESSKTALQFELLSLSERINLLKAACSLMEVSDELLRSVLQTGEYSQHTFKLKKAAVYPPVLEKYFQLLPTKNIIRNAPKIRENTIRSPLATQRVWERLKRQNGVS